MNIKYTIVEGENEELPSLWINRIEMVLLPDYKFVETSSVVIIYLAHFLGPRRFKEII